MRLHRRDFVTHSALACFGIGGAVAQGARIPPNDPRENRFIVDIGRAPDAVIKLWPDGAPGANQRTAALSQHYVDRNNTYRLPDRAVHEVTDPQLSYFAAPTWNGRVLLIFPGGGYNHVVVEKEGFEGARYFNQFGYDAYVADYRLPHQGWDAGPDTPLQDGQRAVRVARAHSGTVRAVSGGVVAMGFSAGGHLVGSLAQLFDAGLYDSIDEIDQLSARPDLAALIYPVALMGSSFTHQGSQKRLLGDTPPPETLTAYDLTTTPNAEGPPAFLMHALDDPAVPYENSLALAGAYRSAGIPAVFHSFAEGGHGFGMRGIENTPRSAWPDLFMSWASANLS